MKRLYLNTHSCTGPSEQLPEVNKYEVVESTSFEDALRIVRTTCFDVLVIDDRGNPGTVRFIAGVRAVRPQLPVFVTSAWGADLPLALDSIAAVKEMATTC